MKLKKVRFLQGASWYLLAQIIQAILSFAVLPILLRIFTPNQFGELTLLLISAQIAAVVFDSGVTNPLTRAHFDSTLPSKEKVLTIGFVTIFINLANAILLSALITQFSSISFETVAAILCFSFSLSIRELILSGFRASGKPRSYFAYLSSSISLGYLLGLISIWSKNNPSIQDYLVPLIIGSFLPLTPAIFKIRIKRFSRVELFEVLRLALPLVPHSVAVLAIVVGDRYVMGFLLTSNEVAIYQVSYTFGNIGVFLLVGLNNVFSIQMYRMEKDERGIFLRRFIPLFLSITLLILAIYVASMPLLINFLVPNVYNRDQIVLLGLLISLSAICYFHYLVYASTIFSRSKVGAFAVITPLSLVFNLALNFVFLQSYGVVIGAVATFFTYLFQCTLVSLYSIQNSLSEWYYDRTSILPIVFFMAVCVFTLILRGSALGHSMLLFLTIICSIFIAKNSYLNLTRK